MRIPLPPPGFDTLTADEKIDYLQSLWDIVAENPSEIEVPDWHRRVLRERLDDARENPQDERPWDEVRAELQERLNRKRE